MHPPEELDTPYLFVDTTTLERNLRAMADIAATLGIGLRPHAKTHKSPPLGRRQLELGAAGLTVATVAEAAVFADGGCPELFLAYPVWAAGPRARRLRELGERTRLRIGVDSAEGAQRLGRALPGADVLIEIDSGHHRSGVPAAAAPGVAAAAERAGLRVLGVFTFPGHGYGPGNRESAAADEAMTLEAADDALRAGGFEVRVRSGGSTPTAAVSRRGVLTEMRPGSYVFNDAQQLETGSCEWADIALFALATVVSRRGRRLVVDAGSKVLGADRPGWASGFGRVAEHQGARIEALSEHHATIRWPADDSPVPALGERLRVVPNHVCTAVNLADELFAAPGPTAPLTPWPVAARGANH